MKWVVDVEQEVTLMKELVIDAPTAEDARNDAEEYVENMSGVIGSDEFDWDEAENGGAPTFYEPVKLLDRRTVERNDSHVVASLRRCDNCDTRDVSTVRYGDARVCSVCLAFLPPLSG